MAGAGDVAGDVGQVLDEAAAEPEAVTVKGAGVKEGASSEFPLLPLVVLFLFLRKPCEMADTLQLFPPRRLSSSGPAVWVWGTERTASGGAGARASPSLALLPRGLGRSRVKR